MSKTIKQLERKLQRRDDALEEQDHALAEAHAVIRNLKNQESITAKKLRDQERRIEKLTSESPIPSPRVSPQRRDDHQTNFAQPNRLKSSPLSVSRRSSFAHDEEVNQVLKAVDATLSEGRRFAAVRDQIMQKQSSEDDDLLDSDDDVLCNNLSVSVDFTDFDSASERPSPTTRTRSSTPGSTITETIASITEQDATTLALTEENNQLRDQIDAMTLKMEELHADRVHSNNAAERMKMEITELQDLLKERRSSLNLGEGNELRTFSTDDERKEVAEEVGPETEKNIGTRTGTRTGTSTGERVGEEEWEREETRVMEEEDGTTMMMNRKSDDEDRILLSSSTTNNCTPETSTTSPRTTRRPDRDSTTRLSVLLATPLTPVPTHLRVSNAMLSTPDASLLVANAAKKALLKSRTIDMGVQCNLTGSLLLTTSIDDDDDNGNNDDDELHDIQLAQEHSKKVRRLHHWHALTGSADLLLKNPGAYEYLLQKVVMNPTESKAIIRDSRCTYAVTSMKHKRIPSMMNSSQDGWQQESKKATGTTMMNDDNSNSSEIQNYELTPFASSLCNILSCFCTMLDMKFISGMNYIAGYCLIACCGDEEASFWLFVSIYKKVSILFNYDTLNDSNKIMTIFEHTLNCNLIKLSKHMKNMNVKPELWMLSNLQTLFSRNTNPRNYTKAVWDAFLISTNPMEVLVRIAVSMIELMSNLILSAKNHSEIIQLIQNPPVDLIRAEPLLKNALRYKITPKHQQELQKLSDEHA
jgi:hypothetical protein